MENLVGYFRLATLGLMTAFMLACIIDHGLVKRVLIILTLAAASIGGFISDSPIYGVINPAILLLTPMAALPLFLVIHEVTYWRIARKHGDFDKGERMKLREAYESIWQ